MDRVISLAVVLVLLVGCTGGKSGTSAEASSASLATNAGAAKDYGPAPDFTLPNVAGGSFRLSTRRRVVLLTFVTADCTEDCPKVEAILRSVAQKLRARGELGTIAEIASVEIDPNTNTVRAVKDLRQRLWPTNGWAFLRGNAQTTRALLKAYQVQVFPRQPGKDLEHESLVYVISRARRRADLLEPKVNLTSQALLRAIAQAHAAN
jgi:cytochrome oxidase Cu insertion factor (SCO1/SenC/PrrC family)